MFNGSSYNILDAIYVRQYIGKHAAFLCIKNIEKWLSTPITMKNFNSQQTENHNVKLKCFDASLQASMFLHLAERY